MIRKTLIVLCLSAFFASCNNDLDITADWKDISVVYGVLNAQDTVHYVKLNKAFLGQGDVMTMAQEFDSLHFNQEKTGLRLVAYNRVGGQFVATKVVEMEAADEILKPEGIFSSPTQIVYKTTEQLDHNRFYSAEVYDKGVDSVIASNTIPIDVLGSLQMTRPNSYAPLNLVPNSYVSKAEWRSLEGGKLYELKIRFYYVEQQITDLSDTLHKHIDWIFPYRQSNGITGEERMSISIDAEQFLNFLAVNIQEDPDVYRQVAGMFGVQGATGFSITHSCMDFTLLAAGEELSTYILLNEGSGSMVTERPEYTNIENGLGILSSRTSDFIEGVKINNLSNDEIAFNDITKHLNFAYFRLGDGNQIDTLYVN